MSLRTVVIGLWIGPYFSASVKQKEISSCECIWFREWVRDGDVGGWIGAGAISETEEGVGMSDGLAGSSVFSEHSVYVLHGEQPSVSAQPEECHRNPCPPNQPWVPPSLRSCPTGPRSRRGRGQLPLRLLWQVCVCLFARDVRRAKISPKTCVLALWRRIAKALNSCSASTGDIISTTERLKQELEITTQRQEIVSCFLRDYQLSNEEVLTLFIGCS